MIIYIRNDINEFFLCNFAFEIVYLYYGKDKIINSGKSFA